MRSSTFFSLLFFFFFSSVSRLRACIPQGSEVRYRQPRDIDMQHCSSTTFGSGSARRRQLSMRQVVLARAAVSSNKSVRCRRRWCMQSHISDLNLDSLLIFMLLRRLAASFGFSSGHPAFGSASSSVLCSSAARSSPRHKHR